MPLPPSLLTTSHSIPSHLALSLPDAHTINIADLTRQYVVGSIRCDDRVDRILCYPPHGIVAIDTSLPAISLYHVKTQERLWRIELPPGSITRIVDLDQEQFYVYHLEDGGGSLFAISPKKRSIIWRSELHSSRVVPQHIRVAEERVAIAWNWLDGECLRNEVALVDRSTGARTWSRQSDGSADIDVRGDTLILSIAPTIEGLRLSK
jgi:hypothetical protein